MCLCAFDFDTFKCTPACIPKPRSRVSRIRFSLAGGYIGSFRSFRFVEFLVSVCGFEVPASPLNIQASCGFGICRTTNTALNSLRQTWVPFRFGNSALEGCWCVDWRFCLSALVIVVPLPVVVGILPLHTHIISKSGIWHSASST